MDHRRKRWRNRADALAETNADAAVVDDDVFDGEARSLSARDRAIATVFFSTGLRLSELAALDIADVSVSARRGRLRVIMGKGGASREVPLNSACRSALSGSRGQGVG